MCVCCTGYMFIGIAAGNVPTINKSQPNCIGNPTALGDAPNDMCVFRSTVLSDWPVQFKRGHLVYRWQQSRQAFGFLRHLKPKRRAISKIKTTEIYREIQLRKLETIFINTFKVSTKWDSCGCGLFCDMIWYMFC